MRILSAILSVMMLSASAAACALTPQQSADPLASVPRVSAPELKRLMEEVRVAQGGGRVAPARGLECDRNDLTLYDGLITAYRRRRGSTFLRIRTNFDTTEEVTIRHPGTDDPSRFYLLNGEPFKRSDWRLIERRKGVLRTGMRANVWVCRDNPAVQPVADWRPDDTGANPRSR